jgi:hypothetical protein
MSDSSCVCLDYKYMTLVGYVLQNIRSRPNDTCIRAHNITLCLPVIEHKAYTGTASRN